ncbi:MAG: hypothetical protein JWO32_1245 [Bacteroidetes bacterium]|nr:hypothetical protein [Bacteroidota bacterium]
MKRIYNSGLILLVIFLGLVSKINAQLGQGPCPYCMGSYNNLPCNQPGPSNSGGNFVNDFINSFNTTGAVTNITNNNSGCNAQSLPAYGGIQNYFFFPCPTLLQVNPGQNITCNFQSGITFGQGFALFVDWNNDGIFALTEKMVATAVPAAGTFISGSFVVPAVPNGRYRMRVRCAYSTPGSSIDACSMFGFGEIEEYNLFVGPIGSCNPGSFTATASVNSPLCSGSAINLSVTPSTTTSISYLWNGPNGFTSTAQYPVIATSASSMSGVYSVSVSGGPGTCPVTQSVNVSITNYPSYTVTPITATLCQGGIFTPSVSFGTVLPGTPCSNIGVGPACSNPNVIQVGVQTGSNSSFSWPAPYGNFYKNARHQLLFTASELTALGITQGYITSLAFNVASISGTTNYPGYTIRLKCTNVTSLTGGFDNTGLTQVYTIANYGVVTGWNTHNFNTPYYWDGVSNLLVDFCYSLTGAYTQNSISPYTTTTFNSCRAYWSDTQPACMTASAPMQTNTNRPLVRFGNCGSINPNQFSYLWTSGPGIAAPTASSTQITTQLISGSVATVFYSVSVTPTVMSCPVVQQLTITVVNPASPTITPLNPLCNTFPATSLTALPGGGVWSTNAAVSAGGIVMPSLASIGTSTVLYTVGIGSCIATNTTNISVSQFNSAAFTSSIAPLCVTNPIIDLNSIVQSTVSGVWSGTGVSGTYSFNPSGLATNTYALIYNTTSTPVATVCPSSNTMVVSVLNPPQPTITAIGPYCNTTGDVPMTVTPNTGTWTPVSYQTASGVFSPSLAAIGNNTVQYIIGTATCNTSQTSTINIEAFVPATITGSISDQCITGSPVNLLPLTAVTSGTWSGPGVTGTTFNPANSGTGVMTLTYSTNSAPVGLCPDTDVTSVQVYSVTPPVLTQIGPFCNMSGNKQISVSPIGGMFYGVNNFAVSQLGVFAPTQANIGPNLVNYSITSGPCVAIAQTTIYVEAFVSADFSSYAGPFCRNDAPVNLNSIVQNPGGLWAGPGVTGSIFTPASANVGNNNFIIYYTHSMPTPSLCPDSSAIRIQVNDIPNVSIVSNMQKGCLPVEVIFNIPNTNVGTGQWNFGDGSESQSGLVTTHMFTTPGSFTVSVSYQDAIGCSAQATLPSPIEAYPMPHANFDYSPNEITIANPEVQFSNLSTVLGDNSYQWQIGNMYQLNEVNPKVIFPVAGDYNIILTATTINGCTDQISKIIDVKNDYGLYVPSSFTPNNDGLNDVFRPVFSPYGLDLKVYDMEVFDRWGHSLFHTKDFTIGWDGTVKSGDEAIKEGVFVYKIKFKDMNGKIHNKTGHVTLLK